ncbi:hypothetical protein OIV83_001979 [Microbotryomycetes sp. JL201]|nr:hypothetical protein OIV83_001979 [Microbotryomycetes sp. JL201]
MSARVLAGLALLVLVNRWHDVYASHLDNRHKTESSSADGPSLPETPVDANHIHWFECPDSNETQCAFVKVPLDHLNASDYRTISLAVRALPAAVPKNQAKGVVFVNPGGPGGSGTDFIATHGQHLSQIVQGRYDILSWDPRGVNLTRPNIDCFENEAMATLFQRDEQSVGLLYEATDDEETPGPSLSQRTWASRLSGYNRAMAQTCINNGKVDVLEHQTTAATARDLRHLSKLVGDHEGVHYWGLSYGTVLGATFAAMFPDSVGRFVLDGVVDSVEFTRNLWQSGRTAMDHTNKTLEGFYEACVQAGPTRCALATTDSTAASLRARIDKLRRRLRAEPLPVVTVAGTGIVKTSDIQHVIFRKLYSPKSWPVLASILANAENGNGTAMYMDLNEALDLVPRNQSDNVFARPMDKMGTGLSCSAIMCSDTDPSPLANTSKNELISYFEEMGRRSIAGEPWSLWMARCRNWPFKAKDVYRGPWSRREGLPKTRNKILFVSNTADPVTPLSAAERMAEHVFTRDSASLLIQDGFGHCSLAHPSLCTAKTIRRYLLDGVVPEYGTRCDSDPGYLFPEPREQQIWAHAADKDDMALVQALDKLADHQATSGNTIRPL